MSGTPGRDLVKAPSISVVTVERDEECHSARAPDGLPCVGQRCRERPFSETLLRPLVVRVSVEHGVPGGSDFLRGRCTNNGEPSP